MKKDRDIRTYSAAELKALRAQGRSRTDLRKVDALTDRDVERRIAADPEERRLRPDWTTARLVLPEPKQSVHLRLDRDVIAYFRSGGKGHLTRMQAVLRAFVEAQKRNAAR